MDVIQNSRVARDFSDFSVASAVAGLARNPKKTDLTP